MKEEIEVYRGSGNVFADLELPDAEEMLVKAELVRQIYEVIRKRRCRSRCCDLRFFCWYDFDFFNCPVANQRNKLGSFFQ